jgi:hypothetical protein
MQTEGTPMFYRYLLSGLLTTAATLFAFPVAAQNSTTRCQTDIWGNTNCTTAAAPSIDWGILKPQQGDPFMDGFERGRREKEQRERLASERAHSQLLEQERKSKEAALIAGRTAGKMVADGDCEGAESYALTEGFIELAKSVKDYCSQN